MRPLTILDTIVDDAGIPIDGRVKVFVHGESTLATLKDYDGNVISNPQSVVNGLTKSQIFLPDCDVTIEVQELVDAEYPSSDDSWRCIRSVVDNYRTVDITNDSKGIYIVGSKDDLRSTTPSQVQTQVGMKCVELYGISGAAPLCYEWVSGYSVNDNDGDVIACATDNTGRWVASIEDDFVDCRYFGIRPRSSVSQLTSTEGAKVAVFLNRCNTLGKRPYFPSTATASYYNIANNSVSNPVVDAGTIFANLSGNVASVYDSEVKLYSDTDYGKITLTADTVRTSQNVKRSTKIVLVSRVRTILDTAYFTNYKWSGVGIVLAVDQDGGVFEGCDFSGVGKVGEGSFTNCRIYESMLDDDFDFSTAEFTNCTSDISSWTDFDNYLAFCVANGDVEVDLHGNVIKKFPEVSSDSRLKLLNAVVNASNADEVIPSNISFRNCTFKKAAISNFFDCDGCVFEKNARCVTDSANNNSGTVSASFVGCFFTGTNSHIVMDFGSSVKTDMGILSFVIKDCVFADVSPVSAVWNGSGSETEQARLNAIKELDISNLYVTGCVGAKWSTDTFIAKVGLTPSTSIPQTSGATLLADVGFPFTDAPSLWEMEAGLYFDQGSSKVRETTSSVRKYVGTYEYLRTATVNGASPETLPTIVIAYAKIRRIA